MFFIGIADGTRINKPFPIGDCHRDTAGYGVFIVKFSQNAINFLFYIRSRLLCGDFAGEIAIASRRNSKSNEQAKETEYGRGSQGDGCCEMFASVCDSVTAQ